MGCVLNVLTASFAVGWMNSLAPRNISIPFVQWAPIVCSNPVTAKRQNRRLLYLKIYYLTWQARYVQGKHFTQKALLLVVLLILGGNYPLCPPSIHSQNCSLSVVLWEIVFEALKFDLLLDAALLLIFEWERLKGVIFQHIVNDKWRLYWMQHITRYYTSQLTCE